jgi:hypothetical protein
LCSVAGLRLRESKTAKRTEFEPISTMATWPFRAGWRAEGVLFASFAVRAVTGPLD